MATCQTEAQPWLAPSSSCEKDIPENKQKQVTIHLVPVSEVNNHAFLCNLQNTKQCVSDATISFDVTNEELTTSCGTKRSIEKNGGTAALTFLEGPRVTNGTPNAVKRALDALGTDDQFALVAHSPDGHRFSTYAKVTGRGDYAPDFGSPNPIPWPITFQFEDDNYADVAAGEVFPTSIYVKATLLNGGTDFSISGLKITTVDGVELVATANAAEVDPDCDLVQIFVNADDVNKVNLFDADNTTIWNGGALGVNPYAGVKLAGVVPLIATIEITADNADATTAPVEFDLVYSGDDGVTETILQSYTGVAWVAGQVQEFTVNDTRSATGLAIAGNTGVNQAYSNVETIAAANTQQSINTSEFDHGIITNLSATDSIWISTGNVPSCSGTNRTEIVANGSYDNILDGSSGTLNICSTGTGTVNVILFNGLH